MQSALRQKPIQEQAIWPVARFNHDIRATLETDGVPVKTLGEVMQFIFHGRMTDRPKKVNEATGVLSPICPGWIHIGRDKEDLAKQSGTKFVRTYSTLLHHVRKGYAYMTFSTFHTRMRTGTDRNRRQINSCHAFVIDIDSKRWPVHELVSFCSEEGLLPSFINETPRGYHIWFVLEQDMVGPHEKKEEITKAGSFYNDMNRFLVQLFQKRFPSAEGGVDMLIGGERYIRIPSSIAYFSGHKVTMSRLQELKELQELTEDNKRKTAAHRGAAYIPFVALERDPAYRRLFEMQPEAGYRRKTAFTIALTYYVLNVSEEQATTLLKDWYEQLQTKQASHHFTWNQVKHQIASAYSGRFHGPKASWVMALTGIKPTLYFTKKLSPEQRKNKTIEAYKEKFLDLIRKGENNELRISNRSLCESLSCTSRNMLDAIVEQLVSEGVIKKQVVGRGCRAETVYSIVPNDPKLGTNIIPFRNKNRRVEMPQQASNLMTQKRIEEIQSIFGSVGGTPFDAGVVFFWSEDDA